MKPRDIQEGGVYEHGGKFPGEVSRRTVLRIESRLVFYAEHGDFEDFTWLDEFARWADRRII